MTKSATESVAAQRVPLFEGGLTIFREEILENTKGLQ